MNECNRIFMNQYNGIFINVSNGIFINVSNRIFKNEFNRIFINETKRIFITLINKCIVLKVPHDANIYLLLTTKRVVFYNTVNYYLLLLYRNKFKAGNKLL